VLRPGSCAPALSPPPQRVAPPCATSPLMAPAPSPPPPPPTPSSTPPPCAAACLLVGNVGEVGGGGGGGGGCWWWWQRLGRVGSRPHRRARRARRGCVRAPRAGVPHRGHRGVGRGGQPAATGARADRRVKVRRGHCVELDEVQAVLVAAAPCTTASASSAVVVLHRRGTPRRRASWHTTRTTRARGPPAHRPSCATRGPRWRPTCFPRRSSVFRALCRGWATAMSTPSGSHSWTPTRHPPGPALHFQGVLLAVAGAGAWFSA
jgi:hypothetical protein